MRTYPEYKDSGVEWMEKIPSQWSMSKIKYETTIPVQYGINISSESYVDSGIRFIRTTDISDNGIIYNEGVFLDPSDVEKIYRTKKYDFLVSRSGSLGRTYVHMNDDELTYGGYLVRFNFGNKATTRFIFYFFKSQNFYDWLVQNTIRSTIGNVNGQKYSNLSIPLPLLSEQKQISNYLDRKTQQIDNLIEKTERKIELLKEQRSSLINQCVTKGLDPNVEMKDSGVEWIGEIPKGWEVKKLKYTSEIVYGTSPPGTTYNDEGEGTILVNGPVEYSLTDFGITRSIKWTTEPKNLVPKGSLLFCVRASTGRMNITHTELSIGRGVCSINSNSSQNYLLYSMMMIRIVIQKQISGSTFPSVVKDDVDNILLPSPPDTEQNQISDYLDHETSKIDQMVDTETKRIKLLKEYRLSLISTVVTGKVDIRDEVVQ